LQKETSVAERVKEERGMVGEFPLNLWGMKYGKGQWFLAVQWFLEVQFVI